MITDSCSQDKRLDVFWREKARREHPLWTRSLTFARGAAVDIVSLAARTALEADAGYVAHASDTITTVFQAVKMCLSQNAASSRLSGSLSGWAVRDAAWSLGIDAT
jgi:hypothetical protein